MASRHFASGFTLIELIVVVVLIAILSAIAVPSYNVWIQNQHIKTAAESVRDGIQRARAEAVARNTAVQFVLEAGAAWTVSVAGGDDIETRGAGESPGGLTVTAVPDGATTVTFGGVGVVVGNVDGSATLTQVDIDSTALTASESRELSVQIGSSGARVCNPNAGSESVSSC